ncbi:hypothetical protein EMIT0158MI4_170097 [Burkholderia ambifaria]
MRCEMASVPVERRPRPQRTSDVDRGERPSQTAIGTRVRLLVLRTGRGVALEVVLSAHPFAQVTNREHVDVVVHAGIGRQSTHFVVEHRAQLVVADLALFGDGFQGFKHGVLL